MRFRFILQPVMVAILAIRHGLNDARTGRSPYFGRCWETHANAPSV
jgi:hypothetical protein